MRKPYDIGNSFISASVSSNGKLISVNAPNREHGYLKLTSVPAFPDGNWYEVDFIRNYRNSFLSEEAAVNGYGIEFLPVEKGVSEKLSTIGDLSYKSGSTLYSKDVNGIGLESHILIPPNRNAVMQIYTLHNSTENIQTVKAVISSKYGIIRASYAQITENGPIPMPVTLNSYKKLDKNSFSISDKGTHTSAVVGIVGNDVKFELPDSITASSFPLELDVSGQIKILPHEKITLGLITVFSGNETAAYKTIRSLKALSFDDIISDTAVYWDRMYVNCSDKVWENIVNRNFAYIFGCCCFHDYGAMITDHQSLPLTWNRDNYFMYKHLEAVYCFTGCRDILDVMYGHIKWLFSNMIDNGWWGRSHLITGRVKDLVFQFDQQCYPILELYDFYQLAEPEHKQAVEKYFILLDGIVNLLFKKQGSGVMLFETDENPADDPVLYPYHFSTQVLAWKMFDVLHEMNIKHNFSKRNYIKMRDQVKCDIFKYMITERNGKKIFCYTTDLKDGFEFYHDANDLPFALAPLWEFIDAEDEIFRNTVEFAFSNENRGYYDGGFGGLGSDHAKGHWPLGDSQLLAIALAMVKKRDKTGKKLWQNTLKTLQSIVMNDGLFSESVYPETGKVFTRYWFAWPGATISWLYLMSAVDKIKKKRK